MYITLKLDAITECGMLIPAGSKPRYLRHVPGGMISIFWNGKNRITDPRTTIELTEGKCYGHNPVVKSK